MVQVSKPVISSYSSAKPGGSSGDAGGSLSGGVIAQNSMNEQGGDEDYPDEEGNEAGTGITGAGGTMLKTSKKTRMKDSSNRMKTHNYSNKEQDFQVSITDLCCQN
ncbi:unnamed protein product [Protopolystoma xenopodis]|uniref:Uncharacterized protein n=1 Tax=Protopolystoma xenopodis TaxID=117903 RepID=A0A448X8Y3_9PLAT|nr:unnamed protein product [Protopolystoma xenopodis]